MKSAFRLALILSSLLFSQIISANAEFNLQTLQNLFQSGQRQAAYEYANRHLGNMEGDANFDYLYGVSAIDTGHASQGVFALERVLIAYPEDHVARLELARGYFILEEYARAREEFETVLATNPPKGVQQTTQVFLDQIRLKEARYQTTSNGYVSIGLGSDSNVNSGAEDGASILGIPLVGDSLGQDDNFTELTAAWQITHPFAPGWLVNTSITGNIKQNQDLDQFDTMTATLQMGVTRLINKSRYKTSLIVQQYNLDGDEYRSLTGLNINWNYAYQQNASFNTSLQYAALDYPTRDDSNSDLITATFGYSHTFATSLAPTLITSLSVGTENAEQDSAAAQADTERDVLGLNISLVMNLTAKTALQTSLAFQTSDYASEQPFEPGVIREDDRSSASLSWLWLFKKDWRMDTNLSYIDNSSNVNFYNYDRTLINLSVNYAF